MRFRLPGLAAMALIVMSGIAQARDGREPVRLPAHMQDHMLANMRDNLVTLNAITGDVADGKFDVAAKLAEQRPGMSSRWPPSKQSGSSPKIPAASKPASAMAFSLSDRRRIA